MARKLTRKQVVYLWAIGYFKRAPSWAPGSLKASIGKKRVKEAVSVKRAEVKKKVDSPRDMFEKAPIDSIVKAPGEQYGWIKTGKNEFMSERTLEVKTLDQLYPQTKKAEPQKTSPAKTVDRKRPDPPAEKSWQDVNKMSAHEAGQYVKQIAESLPKGKWGDDPPGLKALRMLVSTEDSPLGSAHGGAKAHAREVILSHTLEQAEDFRAQIGGLKHSEVITRLKPASTSEFEVEGASDHGTIIERSVKQGLSQLTALIPEESLGEGRPLLVESTSGGRAFARPEEGAIYISNSTVPQVVAHEAVHILEGSSQNWQALSSRFVDEVADTSRTYRMSALSRSGLYTDDEVAYKPKDGIKVSSPYVLKNYETPWASEVLSMSIQSLITDAPQLARNYPEQFRYAVAALRTPL